MGISECACIQAPICSVRVNVHPKLSSSALSSRPKYLSKSSSRRDRSFARSWACASGSFMACCRSFRSCRNILPRSRILLGPPSSKQHALVRILRFGSFKGLNVRGRLATKPASSNLLCIRMRGSYTALGDLRLTHSVEKRDSSALPSQSGDPAK